MNAHPAALPILVTGGAGYIGSHAACALHQAGYMPVVVDSLVNGNSWAMKFGPFEQGDIADTVFIKALLDKYKPAAVMHFAAFIEVGESVSNPEKYRQNNFTKACILFETVRSRGVRHVIFSSTAAVYGNPASATPIKENAPLRPVNPYGQSKLDSETYLRGLDADGVRSVTLRYFNAAGAAPKDMGIGEAHCPETHLIPRMLLPCLSIKPAILSALELQNGFTIYGDDFATPDGTAIRDYVHVVDLAEAHVKALRYLLNGGQTDIFNLGSGTGYSVRQVYETTKHRLGSALAEPRMVSRRAGDPAMLVADILRARSLLDWSPRHSLQNIVESAVEWHGSEHYLEAMRLKTGSGRIKTEPARR